MSNPFTTPGGPFAALPGFGLASSPRNGARFKKPGSRHDGSFGSTCATTPAGMTNRSASLLRVRPRPRLRSGLGLPFGPRRLASRPAWPRPPW